MKDIWPQKEAVQIANKMLLRLEQYGCKIACDVMSEVEKRIWSHIPDDGSKARCLAVLENLSKSNDIEAVLAQYQNMQLGLY